MPIQQTANQTSLQSVLKQLYPQERVKELCYRNNPFLGMLKKNTNFVGKNLVLGIRYAAGQGRSQAFATAQANRCANQYVGFTLTRNHDYAVGGIDTETIRASKGNKGSLVDEMEGAVNGLMNQITRSLCQALFGNGGGAIGRVGSGQGTNTITLLEPNDIVNFETGMILDGSTTDGTSGSVIVGGANAQIVGVDRDLGTITNTGALWNAATGINGIAANNYLFTQGDFGAKLKGLRAWLPTTAPVGGDSFFGVDRSVDATRLAGIRIAGSGAPYEETLQKAMARVFREGGKPDAIFMNPNDVYQLAITLNSRSFYEASSFDVPEVGYQTFDIIGPGGKCRVFADPTCPAGFGFVLQMDTWTLYSLEECPGFLDDDGLKMLRDTSADSYQFRLGYYAQLGCEAPGYNAVVTF